MPDAGAAELDRAAGAARRAGVAWRAVPLEQRQDYLRELVAVIRAHIDELALLVTLEQGKPLGRAKGEINSGLAYCERYASMVLAGRSGPRRRSRAYRDPPGPGRRRRGDHRVELPAAAGAVEDRPRPGGRQSGHRQAVALHAGGHPAARRTRPAGTAAGPAAGAVGRRRVSAARSPRTRLVSKISFTGSDGPARRSWPASAPTLKRLTLELGGNDAGIVLDDVDPAAIATDLYWGGLSNCGQVCAGLKRLYVPERLAADLEAALAEVAGHRRRRRRDATTASTWGRSRTAAARPGRSPHRRRRRGRGAEIYLPR